DLSGTRIRKFLVDSTQNVRTRVLACAAVSSGVSTGDQATTLAARSLTKRYGERPALNAVSFDLRSSELVGIIGPNGAGKTTLLSILAGVLAPDEGQLSRPG